MLFFIIWYLIGMCSSILFEYYFGEQEKYTMKDLFILFMVSFLGILVPFILISMYISENGDKVVLYKLNRKSNKRN